MHFLEKKPFLGKIKKKPGINSSRNSCHYTAIYTLNHILALGKGSLSRLNCLLMKVALLLQNTLLVLEALLVGLHFGDSCSLRYNCY